MFLKFFKCKKAYFTNSVHSSYDSYGSSSLTDVMNIRKCSYKCGQKNLKCKNVCKQQQNDSNSFTNKKLLKIYKNLQKLEKRLEKSSVT